MILQLQQNEQQTEMKQMIYKSLVETRISIVIIATVMMKKKQKQKSAFIVEVISNSVDLFFYEYQL